MSTRSNRLRTYCLEHQLDALFIRATSNIAYLTEFEGVFDQEQAHALLFTAEDESLVLHTDSRYADASRAAARGSNIEIDDALDTDGKTLSHTAWLARRFTSGTIGIEDSIALSEYRALQAAFEDTAEAVSFVETSNAVVQLRAVKDAREVEKLRAAQAVTDAAFASIINDIRPGMTERAVQQALDAYLLAHGADALAFPSIVATGPNGANPHAQPSDAPLEAGQCVVMDFGAKLNGYCSDMTRMVCIGAPDARIRDAYDALREANERAQAMLKPGVTGAEVHELALQVLADAGYADCMGHGLGHGVGLEIHEEPVLAPRNSQPLVAGNVVTVEPGIYLPGEFGMRLEDFGVLTDEGFSVFTQSSHDLVII